MSTTETEVFELDLGGPFTLNEIIDMEELCGVPCSRWFDGTTLEGALRRAIVMVLASRTGEPVELAAAGEALQRTRTPEET